MINRILILLLALSVHTLSACSAAQNQTTVYLVRHTERAEDGTNDPNISELGRQRAATIAGLLRDQDIQHVFSTPFRRTHQTAAPTAGEHGLMVEEYDPGAPAELVESLLTLDGTILVVGHSNTIPGLVNLLTGSDLEDLDETIYDRVYIVTWDGAGEPALHMDYTEPRTPLP